MEIDGDSDGMHYGRGYAGVEWNDGCHEEECYRSELWVEMNSACDWMKWSWEADLNRPDQI